MSDSILKQVEIATYIGNAITRIRKIEKFLKNEKTTEGNAAAEVGQTGNPFLNPYVFFTCEVSSIISDITIAAIQTLPAADDSVGWTIDPGFADRPVTITIPKGGSLPDVGDDVLAIFTGVFSTGTDTSTPRYGLFGAGGASVDQTVIVSIGDDHLVTRTIVGSVVGAEDILVAKSWRNRRTPFDGKTINGYTYVYSSATQRQVTIAASPGFVQQEEVIPRYNLNDVIYATGLKTAAITITVGATPTGISAVDMNNDNREFVRTGFVT